LERRASRDKRPKDTRTINMEYSSSSPTTHRPSLMGPVILITLGAMFLLDQFIPGWGIGRTWPVLLVIIGVLKLVDSARPPRAPRGPQV
jgi:hypothetical protein